MVHPNSYIIGGELEVYSIFGDIHIIIIYFEKKDSIKITYYTMHLERFKSSNNRVGCMLHSHAIQNNLWWL